MLPWQQKQSRAERTDKFCSISYCSPLRHLKLLKKNNFGKSCSIDTTHCRVYAGKGRHVGSYCLHFTVQGSNDNHSPKYFVPSSNTPRYSSRPPKTLQRKIESAWYQTINCTPQKGKCTYETKKQSTQITAHTKKQNKKANFGRQYTATHKTNPQNMPTYMSAFTTRARHQSFAYIRCHPHVREESR